MSVNPVHAALGYTKADEVFLASITALEQPERKEAPTKSIEEVIEELPSSSLYGEAADRIWEVVKDETKFKNLDADALLTGLNTAALKASMKKATSSIATFNERKFVSSVTQAESAIREEDYI